MAISSELLNVDHFMSLIRNSAYNLLGAVVPAVAALLTVPAIVANLGTDEYGVLVLVTSIVGYFALLDVNVTAASIKYLAEYNARRDGHRVAQVWTFGLVLYASIGLIGGSAISIAAHALAVGVFKIPPLVQPEALAALRWAGLGFAAGQLQTYLQSVFQAMQRYDLSGAFESFFGTVASLLTLTIALAGGGIVEIVIARLCLSLVSCVALAYKIRSLVPSATLARPDRTIVRQLTSFSAFSYLSKIAAVAAANTDKLFVGSLVGASAVALFAVPAMLASRVYGLSFRLSAVMFPVASSLAARGMGRELEGTYIAVTRHVVYLNAALCLLLVSFAPELLHYWAGKVFGADAAFVLVFLALAFFVDSLTNLPSLVNDGLGRPKFTGLTAVLRAAAGVVAAYLAIGSYGIKGAAVAQLLVSAIATSTFLLLVHRYSIPVRLGVVVRMAFARSAPAVALACAAAVLALERQPLPLGWFALALVATSLALCLYGWLFVFNANAKAWLLRRVRWAHGVS